MPNVNELDEVKFVIKWAQSQAMEQRGQSQARLSYAESRQSSRNSNRFNYAERERARRSQVQVG